MADELQPAQEETTQPAPVAENDTPGLPDFLASVAQRLEAAETALSQHVAPDAHNALYAGLHDRLATVEQALARLTGGALQLQLGVPELEAIGNALKGHMEQTIFDVLKKHYGLNPPITR